MKKSEKLVIKTVNRPPKENAAELWEWFCEVFDLGSRGNAFEPDILREIAGKSILGDGITSKDLNKKLDVPRSTVIYHLNRFIYSGLVVRRGRRYYLRSGDLESTIEDMQSDIQREFNRMIEFAQQLDQVMESDLNARRQKGRKERK